MNETILEQAKQVFRLLAEEPACSGQASQVKGLVDKLTSQEMTVSIIGQFKRGKSTLANAILQDEILPVGIVPVTSVVTKVVQGPRGAEVRYRNGKVEQVEFARLSSFVSEQENKNNRLGVEEVVLHTPSPFLRGGLTFVDTPGVGSFHKNNTETAYHYMKESDAVIFLLSVDSPINQIEIDFLQNTREFAGRFYFAVNKADLVEKADLTAYLEYCRSLLCQLMETEEINLFPVSAKTGDGIEELKAKITEDLQNAVKEILFLSAEKKLKDMIAVALTQLDFYWKAMNMTYPELDEKFATVSATIEAIREKAEAADGLLALRLNETKLQLSETIRACFGMEYHYEIEQLPEGLTAMDKAEFLRQTDGLCENLMNSLNRILLYREENAYAVVRRINSINRLTRELRKIRDRLA